MTDFLILAKTRRSCRAFLAKPVPEAAIEAMAEAGTWAATGRGAQSPTIVAVTQPALLQRLSRLNAAILGKPNVDPFYGAPLVYIVLADPARPTALYDGSLVLGNLMLEAQELGLGACWIHRAAETFASPEGKALLAELGLPAELLGIGHLAVGYPDPAVPAPTPAPRKANYVLRVR